MTNLKTKAINQTVTKGIDIIRQKVRPIRVAYVAIK